MEFYSTDISFKLISSFLIVGAFLYVAFGVMDKFMIPLLKNWRYSKNINQLWQQVQIIVGSVFFIWYYYLFLRSNLVITLIFSLIVIGLGWSYWKNIFSGILIKFNRIFIIGEVISSNGLEGEIKTINYATTSLQSATGEMIDVPNDQLRSSTIKHVNEGTSVKTHAFWLNSNKFSSSIELMKYAMNCPYISGNQKIDVSRIDEQYRITAMLIDSAFIEDAELYFNK